MTANAARIDHAPGPQRGSADSHATAYRPDIDGLRAVAVLSVIIFHLSKDWLPGGFLGVDIFFVISGYLITSIILREAMMGSFSIARFYERRVRRIAPALIALLTTTTAIGILVLLPLDMVGYAKSQLATLGFVSNVYFWRDGDYFSAAAEMKPLLHTWTLGVEEQFYILFPLLVALLARRPRALLWGAVLGIAAMSLIAKVAALQIGAALPAFYLLPTRAWELGAGALLAMTALRPGRWAGVAAMAGLALIAFALSVGPLIFPARLPVAIPAVMGSVLMVWSGGATIIGRALSRPTPVAIGLISYSLYLWHWPTIVLYRYVKVDEFDALGIVIVLAIMFGMSAFSWRYIERPFRQKSMPARTVWMFAIAGAALLAAAAAAMVAGKGFPGRLDPAAARLNAAIGSNFRCSVSDMVPFGARTGCMLTPGKPEAAELVLLGNSHAQMYGPIVADAAGDAGAFLVPANGCAPFMGINISPSCIRIAERNIEAVAGHQASRVVVLAFAWHVRDRLVDAQGRRPVDDRRALIEGLDRTIDRLKRAGKRVILVGPIQIPDYEFASVTSRSIAFGRQVHAPANVSARDFMAEMGSYIDHFARRSDISTIWPHLTQCAGETCQFAIDGESLFADTNHVSSGALRYFEPAFTPVIRRELDSRE